MTRKLIIILCALGIAYYSVQIYGLRDRISLTRSAPTKQEKAPQKMQFTFTMESTDVDLVETCRQLFRDSDKTQLSVHPDDSKKAILNVVRNFSSTELQDAIDLNKQLKNKACLQNDSDTFAIKVLNSPSSVQ
nr:hypothetical protein [uncultured Undibacterium sp.]